MRNRSLFEKVELLFFSAVGFGCVLTLLRVVMEARLPYELGFGEGSLLGATSQVASGLSLYPPIKQLPYINNMYGPVPYFLGALWVKLFGLSFTMPRLLVTVSAAWCAVLIGLLVRHWGAAPPVSAAFGLLYLAMGVGQENVVYYRVDLIGLAFSLTGLYIYATSRRWYLSAAFFVTGLFCKFTLLAAPLACFVYALCRREWNKALRFALYNVALGALAFAWMQHRTQGWFAFHTVWATALHPYSLALGLLGPYKHLGPLCFLLVLGLALVYLAPSSPALWLPVVYLCATSVSLIAVGKAGSADNYYLEWQAALCLCGGIAYHLLRAQADQRSAVAALVPAALAATVLLNLHFPQRPAPYAECSQAYEYVKTYPGNNILSENVGSVVLAGKPLLVNEPFNWSIAVERGGWPDAEILQLIRSRQVNLVLLDSKVEQLKAEPARVTWPSDVLDAIQDNYLLSKSFNCSGAHFVYQPRTRP